MLAGGKGPSRASFSDFLVAFEGIQDRLAEPMLINRLSKVCKHQLRGMPADLPLKVGAADWGGGGGEYMFMFSLSVLMTPRKETLNSLSTFLSKVFQLLS